MDAVKDFIIERLKKLSNMFKGISIKYAFDSITEFHIIEISPENIRRRDDEYIRWESEMWNDFFAMFPDEDLLISEPCECIMCYLTIFRLWIVAICFIV